MQGINLSNISRGIFNFFGKTVGRVDNSLRRTVPTCRALCAASSS
jgi:hypothetical protein